MIKSDNQIQQKLIAERQKQGGQFDDDGDVIESKHQWLLDEARKTKTR